ncbi:MAG: flagellar filament capping protein FliD [Myxococcota bacterium]|nr:flagellar filament capping protein FliD [Myxococcota bacterium]
MDDVGALGSRLTFGGLSTGLDTGALIDALIQAERRPIQLLQNTRANVDARKAAIQTLNSRLLDVREAARGVDNRLDSLNAASFSEEFLAFQASSSDEAAVTAEASDDAVPGVYSLEVTELATTAQRASASFADPDAALGASDASFTIDFTSGDPIVLTVTAGTTLRQLADAINTAPENDGAVRAELLFDGSGTRLVLLGSETGADANFTVTTDLSGPGATPFLDSAADQDAGDATLTYLGVTVTRSSNEIADLIPGVTLRLDSTTAPGEDVEIEVSRDDEAISAGLQELVDAYNALRDFSIAQSTPDANSRGGPLTGDSLLRIGEDRIRRQLSREYSFTDNPFSRASEVGLRFDASGRLSLDSEVLQGALAQDARAVRELLSGDGSSDPDFDGIATAIVRELNTVLEPSPLNPKYRGVLVERDEALAKELARLDLQIERFEARLVDREEALIRRFSALESLVSTLQTQSTFLGGGGL